MHSYCEWESKHREINGAGKLLTQATGLLSGKPFFFLSLKKTQKNKVLVTTSCSSYVVQETQKMDHYHLERKRDGWLPQGFC